MLQRSLEWFEWRCGRITASEAARVGSNGTAKKAACPECGTKSAPPRCECGGLIILPPGKAYQSYLRELVAERITGHWEEGPIVSAMEHGKEYEERGIAAYEFAENATVVSCSFMMKTDFPNVGCSPDGLVDNDGMIELKCPVSRARHLVYWLDGISEHVPQILFQLGVSGRQWCDFVSYHYDDAFGQLQLFISRVNRSDYEDEIARLMSRAIQLDADVDTCVKELTGG